MNVESAIGFFAMFLGVLPACGSSNSDDSQGSGGQSQLSPQGPVAHNVSEAWPERSSPPSVTPQQVLDACIAAARCGLAKAPEADPVLTVQLCVATMEWSGERAIPLSYAVSPWSPGNERVEFWVSCALAHQDSCVDLEACWTRRDIEMSCEEDGCHALEAYDVKCQGDVATLTPAEGPAVTRDCSRAFAKCSVDSPTGCTDRLLSACPEPPPQPDRCEGDIRLGCDGKQQVSYHDCSALGGSCGEGNCRYQLGAPCEKPACVGDELTVCFAGASLSTTAPDLCTAK